ncbi:hypothetical protein NHQ30_006511 [Ciborinia camelliae]|nr:hypothetical protein NHQ30_006511 [Ciborinia camelliae]
MLSKLAVVVLLASATFASPVISAKRDIVDAFGEKRRDSGAIVVVDAPVVNEIEKRDSGAIVVLDAPVEDESAQ